MNVQELATYAENKTRILLGDSSKAMEDLIFYMIDFLGQEIDFVSDEKTVLNHSDFVILSSKNNEDAAIFQPNIVLLSDVFPNKNREILLQNIVSGGILVYPEQHIVLETQLNKVENFFRKLSFPKTIFTENKGVFQIETTLGEVPMNTNNTDLIEKIEGVRLFFQQLGMMEDEFYEAVMNFE